MAKIPRTPVYKITRNPTHHFFAVRDRDGIMLRDETTGEALVFLDREQALRRAHERWGANETVVVCGMGDEKWGWFQQEVKHRIVPMGER